MSFPIFDPISLPPNAVLVDVNSIAADAERTRFQALALGAWIDATGGAYDDFEPREWSNDEGVFVVYEDGAAIGVVIVTGIEPA